MVIFEIWGVKMIFFFNFMDKTKFYFKFKKIKLNLDKMKFELRNIPRCIWINEYFIVVSVTDHTPFLLGVTNPKALLWFVS